MYRKAIFILLLSGLLIVLPELKVEAKPLLYSQFFRLGISNYINEDYRNSYEYFTHAIRENPNCASAYYFMGLICYRFGDKLSSIEFLKKALKIDFYLMEAREKLADIYSELKYHDDALNLWEKIEEIDLRIKKAFSMKQKIQSIISKKTKRTVNSSEISDAAPISAFSSGGNIPIMRIGIKSDIKELKLWSKGGILVMSNRTKILETSSHEVCIIDYRPNTGEYGKYLTIIPKSKNFGIVVKDVKFAEGFAWSGVEDRQYRGFFEVYLNKKGLSLVNMINIEEYLYSVVPSEMPENWPIEALKAQAVAARSYASYVKYRSKKHKGDFFDLCAEQHCQVYEGIKRETPEIINAVDATQREVLMSNKKIIQAFFSSNCGGNDFYCLPSKYVNYSSSRWIRVIDQSALSSVHQHYQLGKIKNISILKRADSGRITRLIINGTARKLIINKDHKIRAIVPGKLRSANFDVETYGEEDGIPRYFVFYGSGWGHGAGLCQSGAAGMAEKGHKYTDILSRYYKSASFKQKNKNI